MSLTTRRVQVLGIDASRAVSNAPTGTEYYSCALVNALLRADSDLSFRLYTRATPPPEFFPPTTHYEIRAIPFPRLWTHLRLSYEMLTQPPDALFVPAHVLSPIHPRRSIVTVHDIGYKFFPETHPILQRLYLDWSTRWNVSAAHTVIADSYATREDILRVYGARPDKVRVVYPSYDASIFKFMQDGGEIRRVAVKYGLKRPYLLSVGTLHPRKNYVRLIEAVAALPAEYSLVIVGKRGWMHEPLLARVRELGMTKRVIFLDYVPLTDLPALYAGAQFAVLPSLYEGFGFPALEAQACGTPLVCSNSSSLPEVAGEGAVYFDPLNVQEMASALRLVCEDQGIQRALARRGLDNVRRFSWDFTARKVLDLVNAV